VSYLLDTCVLSEEITPRPDSNVDRWLSNESPERIFVSAISLTEIWYGIQLLPVGRRRIHMARWFQHRLLPLARVRILAIDEDVAVRCGSVMVERPDTQVPDALIAATALVHGLTVATRNVRHFVFTGLPVFNPWQR
jgi:predicted nucleic acid-binding protein